jgi:hypothetical protein
MSTADTIPYPHMGPRVRFLGVTVLVVIAAIIALDQIPDVPGGTGDNVPNPDHQIDCPGCGAHPGAEHPTWCVFGWADRFLDTLKK